MYQRLVFEEKTLPHCSCTNCECVAAVPIYKSMGLSSNAFIVSKSSNLFGHLTHGLSHSLKVLFIKENILPTSAVDPLVEVDILLTVDFVDSLSLAAIILTVQAALGCPFLPQRKHSLSL